ncbi:MAG: beta-propeller fold lactonase family protein, partial [Anaerolineae bacterium]|nr:beta-propeller fold lactonase family protein [Anaerolineae bacterium]
MAEKRATNGIRYTGLLLLVGIGLLLAGLTAGQTVVAQVSEPTPFPLYYLPDAGSNRAYSSGSLVVTGDGRQLVASNLLSNTLSVVLIVAPNQPETEAEIPVGKDPRGVAVTLDGNFALAANHGDNTLSVVSLEDYTAVRTIDLGGSLPYGVVINDNQTAYVSLLGSSEVVAVDIINGVVSQRFSVPGKPSGLALWGDLLYVTDFWTGTVSLLYLPHGRVIDTLETGLDLTTSQAIELDITRGIAYLPQTRSNPQNLRLTFDTTVFPLVNVIDLRGLTLQPARRITLDTADRPVNMPFAIALDRFRNWLYVANAGSNDVSVIDLATGQARANIPVGSNPRAIVLNRDNTYAFVHNALDGTITIISTNTLESVDVLPIGGTPSVSVDILIGAQLFHSAVDPRLSMDRWISCANCHFDGQPDGLTWQGFPDGPRNTPTLYNLFETPPYNWSGTWDELADVELKIRWLQSGSGLIEDFPVSDPLGDPHTGLSPDLDT